MSKSKNFKNQNNFTNALFDTSSVGSYVDISDLMSTITGRASKPKQNQYVQQPVQQQQYTQQPQYTQPQQPVQQQQNAQPQQQNTVTDVTKQFVQLYPVIKSHNPGFDIMDYKIEVTQIDKGYKFYITYNLDQSYVCDFTINVEDNFVWNDLIQELSKTIIKIINKSMEPVTDNTSTPKQENLNYPEQTTLVEEPKVENTVNEEQTKLEEVPQVIEEPKVNTVDTEVSKHIEKGPNNILGFLSDDDYEFIIDIDQNMDLEPDPACEYKSKLIYSLELILDGKKDVKYLKGLIGEEANRIKQKISSTNIRFDKILIEQLYPNICKK